MTDYRVLARTAAARLNALIARFLPHAKPVRYLLVVFVAALVTALSVKCRAGTIMFEAGSTVIRGETPSIGLYMQTPRADRGGDYNYECGLGLVGSSRDQTASHDSGPQRNQMFAECLIVDGFQRVDLGLGLAYLQNVDWYNGSNLNFSLLARWRITDRFWLTYRHWSNSGTVMPNRGRDRTMGGFVLVLP